MKKLILTWFIFNMLFCFSQDLKNKATYLDQIKLVDISHLWNCERFQIEEDTTTVERPEPLGYIGDNYQRFYIHFISIIKNPENVKEYLVYGKTKVKNNICDFQGSIKISEAFTYSFEEISDLKQGYLSGTYEFFENPIHQGSGILKGKFTTQFFIDTKNKIQYNALFFGADGYDNNQFEGSWTSYQTLKSKTCNWGDYRIPNSENLDHGAGEFSPTDTYIENGWKSYRDTYMYYEENSISINARKKEQEKWWLNK